MQMQQHLSGLAQRAKERVAKRAAEREAAQIFTLKISCLRSMFRKNPTHVLHLLSMFVRITLKCCSDASITRIEFANFSESAKSGMIREVEKYQLSNMQNQRPLMNLINIAEVIVCPVQPF